MPLDFEKLKQASHDDLVTLGLCEFSRMVDAFERLAAALERIAPDTEPASPEAETPAQCPHPLDSRIDRTSMGQEKGHEFICAACQAHIRGGVVVE